MSLISKGLRRQGGFSMAEVVIAMVLFTASALGIAGLLISSGNLSVDGAMASVAGKLAAQRLEQVKTKPFYVTSSRTADSKSDIDDNYYTYSPTILNNQQFSNPAAGVTEDYNSIGDYPKYKRRTAVKYVVGTASGYEDATMDGNWVPNLYNDSNMSHYDRPRGNSASLPTTADLHGIIAEVTVSYQVNGLQRTYKADAFISDISLATPLLITRISPTSTNLGTVDLRITAYVTVGTAYQNGSMKLWQVGHSDLIGSSFHTDGATEVDALFSFTAGDITPGMQYNVDVVWNGFRYTLTNAFTISNNMTPTIGSIDDGEPSNFHTWGYSTQMARRIRITSHNVGGTYGDLYGCEIHLLSPDESIDIPGSVETIATPYKQAYATFNLTAAAGRTEEYWKVKVYRGSNIDPTYSTLSGFQMNPAPTVTSVSNNSAGGFYDWGYRDLQFRGSPTKDTKISNIVATTNPFGVPTSPCYDSVTDQVYAPQDSFDYVAVINGVTNAVTRYITVGNAPVACVFNPLNNYIYCTNYGSNSVSVIDGANVGGGVIATVGLPFSPYGITFDSSYDTGTYTKGIVYVAGPGANAVCAINCANNAVTPPINVGATPYGVVYSPYNSKVYVANCSGTSISLIDGNVANASSTLNTVIGTTALAVGSQPFYGTYDSTDHKIYFGDIGNNALQVVTCGIGGTADGLKVIGTAAAGGLSAPYAPAYNPNNGLVYVPNAGGNTISVIVASTDTLKTVIGSDPNGLFSTPVFPCFDTSDNDVMVTNYGGIPATSGQPFIAVINGMTTSGTGRSVQVNGSFLYGGGTSNTNLQYGNYTCPLSDVGYVANGDTINRSDCAYAQVSYDLSGDVTSRPNSSDWRVWFQNGSVNPAVMSPSTAWTDSAGSDITHTVVRINPPPVVTSIYYNESPVTQLTTTGTGTGGVQSNTISNVTVNGRYFQTPLNSNDELYNTSVGGHMVLTYLSTDALTSVNSAGTQITPMSINIKVNQSSGNGFLYDGADATGSHNDSIAGTYRVFITNADGQTSNDGITAFGVPAVNVAVTHPAFDYKFGSYQTYVAVTGTTIPYGLFGYPTASSDSKTSIAGTTPYYQDQTVNAYAWSNNSTYTPFYAWMNGNTSSGSARADGQTLSFAASATTAGSYYCRFSQYLYYNGVQVLPWSKIWSYNDGKTDYNFNTNFINKDSLPNDSGHGTGWIGMVAKYPAASHSEISVSTACFDLTNCYKVRAYVQQTDTGGGWSCIIHGYSPNTGDMGTNWSTKWTRNNPTWGPKWISGNMSDGSGDGTATESSSGMTITGTTNEAIRIDARSDSMDWSRTWVKYLYVF